MTSGTRRAENICQALPSTRLARVFRQITRFDKRIPRDRTAANILLRVAAGASHIDDL